MANPLNAIFDTRSLAVGATVTTLSASGAITAGNGITVSAGNLVLGAGYVVFSNADGLVAFAGGGQASATQLAAGVNRIATVATAADSVKLPVSLAGMLVIIINNATNPCQVFGAGTDTINGVATATGISQPGNSIDLYACPVAGKWFTESGVGFSGSLFTESAKDAITAFAGGGQTNATLLAAQTNRITTVATAADSVKLPVSAAGLEIIVINSGANAMQVFGSGTDTINDVATATGVSQPANSIDVYACPVAGKWYVEPGVGFSAGLFTESVQAGITAFAGGGQASATQLAAQTVHVGTVATAGDSVKLPASAPGLELMVINKGANAMQVYGLGADTIDDQAAATGVSQMANSLVIYTCAQSGKWYSEGLATGFGGPGLQTISYTNSITAFAGGGQASAVALTTMLNRIATVATAGDSVRLPTSAPGLVVYIDNRGANPCQVFGAGTDTINGIATATGVPQGVNTVFAYVCSVAGNWETSLGGATQAAPITLAVNGAVNPHNPATYVITKAGVLADTLAAPTATTDDGVILTFTSNTANAHTITATGLFQTGTASVNLATFAANAGAGFTAMAYQGKWNVLYSIGVTFS
jgi:hypothetical protein